jgi:hypothetical protein
MNGFSLLVAPMLALTVAMQPNEDQVQGLPGFEALMAGIIKGIVFSELRQRRFGRAYCLHFFLFGVEWNRVHYY